MIINLSELLKALVEKEKKYLNEYKITHAPTIGNMFEGLTQNILERAIPATLDLRVVSGFVVDGYGNTSGQIDCMVVRGGGEKIPYTKDFKWEAHNVIAVIEVKKNLLSNEISDAYDQTESVYQIAKSHQKFQQENGTFIFNPERAATEYANILHELPPQYLDTDTLPKEKKVIYNALVHDLIFPVKILLGYNGYRTETGLRNGLKKFLSNKQYSKGEGAGNFPNLIISDGFSIVKMNGMPYKSFWKKGWGWCILGSSNANPIYLILEIIRTKIELSYSINLPWGLDLREENLIPFIHLLPKEKDNIVRLNMLFNQPKPHLFKNRPPYDNWKPFTLTVQQHMFISTLNHYNKIELDHPTIKNFIRENKIKN
ncbi:hypothetical protein SM875_002407, partial [Yersinia enterocolitica]|nr:hypothetical protein [Yersinia enterocolitica]